MSGWPGSRSGWRRGTMWLRWAGGALFGAALAVGFLALVLAFTR